MFTVSDILRKVYLRVKSSTANYCIMKISLLQIAFNFIIYMHDKKHSHYCLKFAYDRYDTEDSAECNDRKIMHVTNFTNSFKVNEKTDQWEDWLMRKLINKKTD